MSEQGPAYDASDAGYSEWHSYGGELEVEYDVVTDRFVAYELLKGSDGELRPHSIPVLSVDAQQIRWLYRLPRLTYDEITAAGELTVARLELELAWAESYFHHELWLRSLIG